MREFKSTKEKLLDKALYLIGKKGATDVSIREIAKEAGVNVGAINYHFQSKELMFKQMDEFFISNFEDAYKLLDDESLDAKEKIYLWAKEVLEYTLRYPGILVLIKDKKNLHDGNQIGKYLLEYSETNFEKFDKILREFLSIKDEVLFQYNKMILVSALIFPATDLDITDNELLRNSENRLKYIKHLLDVISN